MKKSHLKTTLGLAMGTALLLSGCQTYTQQSAAMLDSYRIGDFATAAHTANVAADKNQDNKDTVLYRLEQGAILRAAALSGTDLPELVVAEARMVAGPEAAPESLELPDPREYFLEASLEAFSEAESKVNDYESGPGVKVGSEISANLTNQANMPYRGRAYDKVLMNTYKALNYMEMGDFDSARVELNRALERQRDAVAENAKRLEEAQAEVEAAKNGEIEQEGQKASYDVDKAMEDPQLAPVLADLQNERQAKIVQTYADYVNPFAVFMDGLFYTYHGVDASDLERARKSLERVSQMVPTNSYIAADLQAVSEGVIPENVTYVIFETGMAPWRDQLRIDIPTFVVTSSLSYVGASFPRLKFSDNYLKTLTVASADGTQTTTEIVSDMDSVVAKDFDNEWPVILTRTLISTATKAAIDAVIQKQASDNFGWQGQLIAKVATVATQAALNIADTRTWRTLPKQFQYARIATPENRQLTLLTELDEKVINIEPGQVNVVYVKSTAPLAPVHISQFTLK